MLRLFCLFSVVFFVSACRYESKGADYSVGEELVPMEDIISPTAKLYVRDDQKQILFLVTGSSATKAKTQSRGGDWWSATIDKVVKLDGLPSGVFVAVSKQSEETHYYAFGVTDKGQILWIEPSRTDVKSRADLVSAISADFSTEERQNWFALVPAGHGHERALVGDFAVAQLGSEAEEAFFGSATDDPLVILPTKPPASMDQQVVTLDGYAVGDGVYLQGWLSDETGMIQAIDETNRTVKVLRYSDGTSSWVSIENIISRDQATANDLARTAGVGLVLLCIFNPEACSKN